MILRTAILFALTALAPAPAQEIPELRNVQKIFEAGRFKDSAEAAERVISQYPNRPEGYVAAARAWGQLRRFRKMVVHLTTAHQLAPENPTALLNLATALYNQAKWSQALFYLRKLDSLLARLGPNKKNVDQEWKVPWMRGICAVKLEHVPEGIRSYTRSIGLATQPQARAQVRERLAGVLLNSGRTEDAAVQFARLVEEQPGNAQHHYHLGVALLKLNRLDEAEKALMEARRRQPDNYRISVKIGTLHRQQKQLLKALSFFQLAVEANPKAYEPWYALSQIHSLRNNLDEADTAHEEYEKLYALSEAAEETSRQFNRRIKNSINDAAAYFEFAMFLLQHGKLQDAEERLLQLLSINPYHNQAIINVAQILAREQRFQEAVFEFDKILERDPDHPIANLESARALLNLGQMGLAYPRIMRSFTRMDRARNTKRYLDTLQIFAALAARMNRIPDVIPEIEKALKIFDSDANMLGKLLPTYGQLALRLRQPARFFEAGDQAIAILGPDHPDYKKLITSLVQVAEGVQDEARFSRYSKLLQAIR